MCLLCPRHVLTVPRLTPRASLLHTHDPLRRGSMAAWGARWEWTSTLGADIAPARDHVSTAVLADAGLGRNHLGAEGTLLRRRASDEGAAVHHWITSSARANSDGGIVSPSAFAVLR